MSLKSLIPLAVVPAPVASTAWVGYEVMQGDEKSKTDIDTLKEKNKALNGELDKVNSALKSMSTDFDKAKKKIEEFESSIKEVEKLKTAISSKIDEKMKQFKEDIKKEVKDKFEKIKFGEDKKSD